MDKSIPVSGDDYVRGIIVSNKCNKEKFFFKTKTKTKTK
jgi:hypothetical protein